MEIIIKFVLIVGLQVCLPLVESKNKDLFRSEPHNITVEIGGFALFSSTTLNPQQCGSIQWVYSDTTCNVSSFKTIGSCKHPTLDSTQDRSRRLSLSFKDPDTSLLNITDVKKEDSGLYALFLSGEKVGHSSCAFLTVVNSSTPNCDFKPRNPSIGDTISLDCQVPEEAKLPTKLTWQWNTSTEEQSSKRLHPGMHYQLEHILKEADNFKAFKCIAGNSINDGPWCSVYPLMMNMTVYVLLHQTFKYTGYEGVTLQLECIVVPGTTHHQWSLWNANTTQQQWIAINQDRYKLLDSGRFLRITNITNADDGLIITCTAFNDIGMNVTSEPVRISHCSVSNIYVTDKLQCNQYSPLNYIGIAVIYLLALLAVISVYWHFIICRREENDTMTQESELREAQSLKVFAHDDEIDHSETKFLGKPLP